MSEASGVASGLRPVLGVPPDMAPQVPKPDPLVSSREDKDELQHAQGSAPSTPWHMEVGQLKANRNRVRSADSPPRVDPPGSGRSFDRASREGGYDPGHRARTVSAGRAGTKDLCRWDYRRSPLGSGKDRLGLGRESSRLSRSAEVNLK
jgi:hypothetical protein